MAEDKLGFANKMLTIKRNERDHSGSIISPSTARRLQGVDPLSMVFCWNMFRSGGLLGFRCFSQCHRMIQKKMETIGNQQDQQGSKRTDCGLSIHFLGRMSKRLRPHGPETLKSVGKDQGPKRRKALQETVYTGITLQAEIKQLSLAAAFSERASDDRHVFKRISSLCDANTTHHEHFTSQDVSCFRDGS